MSSMGPGPNEWAQMGPRPGPNEWAQWARAQQGPNESPRMGPNGPGPGPNEWEQRLNKDWTRVLESFPINLHYYKVRVRIILAGYVAPGCVEDGAWMVWENSS